MVCDSPLYSFPFIVEFLPFSPGFELYNEEAIVERKFRHLGLHKQNTDDKYRRAFVPSLTFYEALENRLEKLVLCTICTTDFKIN